MHSMKKIKIEESIEMKQKVKENKKEEDEKKKKMKTQKKELGGLLINQIEDRNLNKAAQLDEPMSAEEFAINKRLIEGDGLETQFFF
jgi:hypothetical protein